MARRLCGGREEIRSNRRSPVAGEQERKGEKKKLVLHLWGILNSLSVPFALPPLSPGIHGAPVHFHARPLHFLTSSRLTCLVEKRARLVETARSSVGSHVGKGEGELKLEPSPPLPPILLYLLNLLPLSSRCSIRARLKRKLQRRRGRSTSGEYGEYAGISSTRETSFSSGRLHALILDWERERKRTNALFESIRKEKGRVRRLESVKIRDTIESRFRFDHCGRLLVEANRAFFLFIAQWKNRRMRERLLYRISDDKWRVFKRAVWKSEWKNPKVKKKRICTIQCRG